MDPRVPTADSTTGSSATLAPNVQRRGVVALIGLLAWALSGSLRADERIVEFSTRVDIDARGSLSVTETITVDVENQQIRHGIYRDFPTLYPSAWGLRTRVPFEVVEVLRDDEPERYEIESLSNGVRVRMGSASSYVSKGRHTWTLRYWTDRQLGIFADKDELYWNATGNDWSFPIDRAIAEVGLPREVPSHEVELDGYTGPFGSREQAVSSSYDPESGVARFEATRPFAPGEGLTVVVGFPKGLVAVEPREAGGIVEDNLHVFFGLLGLVVVLLYYWVAWTQVGKDPPPGDLAERTAPPAGVSPAAARYIRRMGWDQKCAAVALTSLASKGHLEIRERDDVFSLRRLRGGGQQALSSGEEAFLDELSRDGDSIDLVSSSHERVGAALKALKRSLSAECDGHHFARNRRWLAPGVALAILTFVAALLCAPAGAAPVAGFLLVWLTFWTLGVSFLLLMAWGAWRVALAEKTTAGGKAGAFGLAVFLSLFSVPFVGGEIAGLWFFATTTSPWLVPVVIGLVGVHPFFYRLLKRPTAEGRRLLDELDGFRRYIVSRRSVAQGAAELERLEPLLPYAIALDVEDEWGEVYAEALEAGGRPDRSGTWWGYPWWLHHGSRGDWCGGLSSGLSSAVSSASSAPGSSSGGGGGGSSGGGGGGGGGGGW